MPAYDILQETAHWLAVNKPCGLNVEQLWDYPSIESDIRHYLQNPHNKKPYLGIVHRLDRPVSGVLLLAKKKQPLRLLNEQFAKKEITKTYWAITEAVPDNEQGVLTHYLLKDQKEKRAIAFKQPKGKAVLAHLSFKVLKKKDNLCLLEIRPHAGKFHQIRVQLSAMGCPILGDFKYGAKQHFIENGIALHAQSIIFSDPATGLKCTLTAPVPDLSIWKSW